MYVKEYLSFIAAMYNCPKSRVQEMIELTGLGLEQHKILGQLSKGIASVGLAAALIHNPEVLILDEPTTGLDPNQMVEIRQLFEIVEQIKPLCFHSHHARGRKNVIALLSFTRETL